MTIQNYDIIIVGDGILAYSTAFYLFQKNAHLKIALIGCQESSNNSASLSAGAMLSCFSEVTTTTFSNEAKKNKFNMGYQALKDWPQWIDDINQYSSKKLEIKNGTYVILNSKSGNLDTKNYLSMIQALENYQESYEEISPEDIPGINSLESCRPLRSIYLPNEGYINPIEFLETLKEILQFHYHLEFFKTGVEKLNYKNFNIESVTLKSGEQFFSPKIVLATGAYTQTLIDQLPHLKNKIPIILSGVGYALIADNRKSSINHVIRTPNRAGSCGLHILPRGENSFYIGATNNVYTAPQTTLRLGLTQFLMKCAIEQIDQNFYNSEIIKWIVGNRPLTIDTFPLIGSTSIKGLYLITGTYREGFHLSPHIAPYIASIILEENDKKENILLRPERPFIKMMSIEESIDEYIIHYIAGCYEHGMNLPHFLHEKEFLNPLRNQILDLYEQIGIDFGLSPEILLMIILSEEPKLIIKVLKEYFSNKEINFLKTVA